MFTSACGVLSPHPHPHTINIFYAYALYTDYRVAILVVVLYCVHMEGFCVARLLHYNDQKLH